MTKFTKNWKLGVIGVSLIVSHVAVAKIEDVFRDTKPVINNLNKWVTDLFDIKIKDNLNTFVTRLKREVLDSSNHLLPEKGAHYLEPEKQMRSMIELLHTQLNKLSEILTGTKASFMKPVYMNIAEKLQTEFRLTETLSNVNDKFDTVIKLIKTSHPALAKEMIEFKTNVMEPARKKWLNKQKSDLLSALKHRCACK